MEAGAEQPPWQPPGAPTQPEVSDDSSGVVDEFAERPEVFVGAAFAGGLAVALILRRLGR
jgi:hypothetical protein